MAFDLSEAQQEKLDAFLGNLLDAYASGEVTKSEVIGVLAHVFIAGVIDNESEVRACLRSLRFSSVGRAPMPTRP